MIALTLRAIADAVGGRVHPHGADDDATVVSGTVDTDSRVLGPGDIFVAKPGEHADGHDFVAGAVERGAVLAIVERVVDVPVSQIVVPDAVAALADLARAVVADVRAQGNLRIVGVTGSNGKTTTKNLLARILQDEGETVFPRASFNNEVGAPLTMLRTTRDTRFLVNEFGAAGPGQIARLAGLVEPDIGIVLMVGLAHAGGFGGVEATQRAKSELVLATRPEGTVVLNVDDPRVAAMAELAPLRTVRWFGRGPKPTSAPKRSRSPRPERAASSCTARTATRCTCACSGSTMS